MTTRDAHSSNGGMAGLPTAATSKPAIWLGRATGGLVILFMLVDGAIKLVPWPAVTEAMDRMGYGSSEGLARCLGAISLVCTVLCAFPPTSFVGAILAAGYLSGAMASHVRIDSPLFTHVLFGFYLGVMLCGGFWPHGRLPRTVLRSLANSLIERRGIFLCLRWQQ
jgi:hypothetical protein